MVDFIDMEKAYDIVNSKKLFGVMREYGVQGIFVDVIDRIYDGSMVKFEMESIWLDGVRVILVWDRDVLGIKVAQCRQCFKYLIVNKDGGIEKSG